MNFKPIATILLSMSLAACAYTGGNTPVNSHETSAGTVLTTPEGKTLYTFDKDRDGQSNCYGECAAKWPPYLAGQDAQPGGDYSIIVRKDGSQQWAHKGSPLYTWFKDTGPGDAAGNGRGGVWHVIPYETPKRQGGYGGGGSY
ncbi:COG4315 family predicted lipoprotein [Hahella ganghwensis]|uniref:COG4315 family predicted lipoprotein n=1 Tax=Hahella ganghwensis TaxID=286420 RepID=UPI00036B6605|nr:hypothetical protein [Hahella ganghwensis]